MKQLENNLQSPEVLLDGTKVEYSAVNVTPLNSSLFPDPAIRINLKLPDGSVILDDGSRVKVISK